MKNDLVNLYTDWLGVKDYIKFDETEILSNVVSDENLNETVSISSLENTVSACTLCRLCESRTNTVFGSGNINSPDIMFIGEGPGVDEDRTGLPFVGKAGELLTAAIEKGLKMKREDLYIANVIKCRPPENRTPLPDELETCRNYIETQIDIIKPKIIVTLGAPAAKVICDIKDGITKVRGNWMEYKGIKVMPTLHPAYILRNPPAKKDFWEDLKLVLSELGE